MSGLAWNIESLVVFQTGQLPAGLMQPLIAVVFLYQIFPPTQRGLALGLSMVGWSFCHWPARWRCLLRRSTGAPRSMCSGASGCVRPHAASSCFCRSCPAPPHPQNHGPVRPADHDRRSHDAAHGADPREGREGWDSSYIGTLLAIGILATVLFLLVEWRSPAPLVDLRLFRTAPFALASLVVFISSMAFRGTGILTILFVQQLLERTPLEVGCLLLLGNIAYGVAVMLTGGRPTARAPASSRWPGWGSLP